MVTVYLVCAVVGGVILVMQLLLTLSGLLGDADHTDLTDSEVHHDSSWFFEILSFRSLVAALTFFGLGGGLANSVNTPAVFVFFFAVGMGAIAMVGVAWILHLLLHLREEGNVCIEYTLDAPATVYLTIPGQRQGQGKVTVAVQNRSMEYNAVTNGETLPSGINVKITNVIDDNTVEVEALARSEFDQN